MSAECFPPKFLESSTQEDTTPPHQVDRIHYSSISSNEFHQRYYNPGIPVIISGLISDTPVWDLDFLSEALGNQTFPVRKYGQTRYQQDKREWTSIGSGVDALSMPFSDYVNCLKTGVAKAQDLYLARCSLNQTSLEQHPTLVQAEAWFSLKYPATYLNLWVGPGGHTSCLHYDPMDGLLMQLHGMKKIVLFPPDQIYNLYPIPIYKHLRYGLTLRSVYSQVYPEKPDFEAFPRFQLALNSRREVILYPGEILFLPAGWWHEVTALGEDVVCSVNRFWTVFPISRALLSWAKWRAHLGSIFALPHILKDLLSALIHKNSGSDLRTLIQRL